MSVDQFCPICFCKVAKSERYPKYICAECSSQAKSEQGRPLKFFNESLSGGFFAILEDTGERHNSHICIVRGVKCFADEARFGGIVIQKM